MTGSSGTPSQLHRAVPTHSVPLTLFSFGIGQHGILDDLLEYLGIITVADATHRFPHPDFRFFRSIYERLKTGGPETGLGLF